MKQLILKIFRNGNVQSLLGNLTFSAFGLLTFLILVRHLDKAAFGQWVLFITVATLTDMFRLGLTGTAAIRMISRTPEEPAESKISAASYQLSLTVTLFLSVVFGVIYFTILHEGSTYAFIFKYYPLLALANLPYHQALTRAQGKINFLQILIIRSLAGALSFTVLSMLILTGHNTLDSLLQGFILAYALTSFYIIVNKHDGWQHLRLNAKNQRHGILKFGKYSTASYLGSNLLKSTDTILLGMFPFMGPEAIAVYAIPFKFVEMVEIPLRSFTATAFPRLSKAIQNGTKQFMDMFCAYTLRTMILLFPVAILLFCFRDLFLSLIGSNDYVSQLGVQKQIITLICIYIIIVPLDRYTGVALFALDKPRLNFNKIIMMLLANIVFDLMAIVIFKSLVLVALATLLFTATGIVTGWHYLKSALPKQDPPKEIQHSTPALFLKKYLSGLPEA